MVEARIRGIGEETRLSSIIAAYYDRLALLLFGRVSQAIVSAFELERTIREAGMDVHPVTYVARLLMHSLVAGIILGGVAAALAFSGAPLLGTVIVAIMAFLVPLIIFGIGLSYPSSKRGSREKAVDSELPYFAAYMTTMAFAGTSPEHIFEKISKLKVFKAIREEALRILRDVKVFGQDPLAAIERNAYYHPSRLYRDLLLGYTTTVKTGGDVLHYLVVKTIDIFHQFGENLKGLAERVGMIIEAYIAVAVIGTLSFYIFFVVSGILPAAGGFSFGGITGIAMYSFLMMPLLTVMMLLVIDASQPKTPLYYREPYAWLVISIALGVSVLVAGLIATGSYRALFGTPENLLQVITLTVVFVIALLIVSLIPAAVYMRIMRRLRRLHHSLAAFLRDLAEVRKTGLSPEKTIIMLSEREYGALTPIVKRIAGALALGLPVEKAVREAVKGIKDWFLLVNLRTLVDAIDVGGGTPQILDTMARYVAELAAMVDELKRRLRSYAFIPYFGSILITVSSLMTIVALVQAVTASGLQTTAAVGGGLAVSSLSPQTVLKLISVTLVGSVFNAWLMGLMVGKVRDMSVAAGFIHAALLSVITAAIGIATIVFSAPTLLATGA